MVAGGNQCLNFAACLRGWHLLAEASPTIRRQYGVSHGGSTASALRGPDRGALPLPTETTAALYPRGGGSSCVAATTTLWWLCRWCSPPAAAESSNPTAEPCSRARST